MPFVTSSFLLLVVMHLLLVAMHLLLVASFLWRTSTSHREPQNPSPSAKLASMRISPSSSAWLQSKGLLTCSRTPWTFKNLQGVINPIPGLLNSSKPMESELLVDRCQCQRNWEVSLVCWRSIESLSAGSGMCLTQSS